MTRVLDVYFRDAKAGVLGRLDDGVLTFAYDGAYLLDQRSRAISFSMPLQEGPFGDQVSEADALVAELADEGFKHPILSAIRKVISSRAGSLQRVTEQPFLSTRMVSNIKRSVLRTTGRWFRSHQVVSIYKSLGHQAPATKFDVDTAKSRYPLPRSSP